MDFSFTVEQEKFRNEVKEFLEEEIRKGTFEIRSNNYLEVSSPELSRKLASKGWLGLTWPKKYMGGERSYVDRAILMEELLKYQAPLVYHLLGERQIGPGLLHFGSEELKNEFLPKILKAEISFCLGLSEPDAGSDVAAVSTSAAKEGEYYIINGQKTWTSNAHNADYIWILVKTDPEGPKYKNLSEMIVDLKLPGVTVRPLYNMIGVHCFNEVFFDNVRVHQRYLVGEKNKGFYQMLSQVDYERAGIERLMQNYPVLEALRIYVKEDQEISKDSLILDQMAQLEIEFEIGRLLCYQVAWTIDQGIIPNRESAISKCYCTRFEQKLGNIATQILGEFGQLLPDSPEALFDGDISESYLWNPSYTIQGGASEILKGIIATRGLGLTFKKDSK